VGPLVIGLIAPLVASVKQKLAAYGLMALAGLIILFSAGYALDAGHSMLMFRYGSVAASLIVAGGLFLAAIACAVTGLYLKYRRAPSRPALKASPYSNPPFTSPVRWRSIGAIMAMGAGVATSAAAVLSSERLRKFIRDRGGNRPT